MISVRTKDNVSEGGDRAPIDLICVIDNSGSMRG